MWLEKLRSRGAAAVGAFGLYATGFWLWQAFQWGGPDRKVLIADLVTLPGALIAALFAWRTATHGGLDPRARRGWRLVGLAFLAYWVADLLWVYYELVLGVEPFPSAADVGYLLFYPMMMLGLLSFPVARRGREERVKFWLDGATVVLAGWMVVWHLIIGPVAVAAKASDLATVLSVAYPLGDLLLLFGIVATVLRRPEAGSRRALAILAGGLLLYVVADLGYGALSVLSRYESGDWPDALWMAAYVLAAAAAECQHQCASRGVVESGASVPAPSYSLVPYAAVLVGNVLLLLVAARQQVPLALGGLIVGAVGITGLVMARQITVIHENMRLMADLHALAITDSLTGLPNRRGFYTLASERFADGSSPTACAILIDLDDFKEINDAYGHEVGDELLAAVADRLRASVRASDAVARLGGDEFAILLGSQTLDDAAQIAARITEALRRPFRLRVGEVTISASVGVAVASPDRDDAGELLRRADLAMYAAKRRGKGRYEVLTGSLAAQN